MTNDEKVLMVKTLRMLADMVESKQVHPDDEEGFQLPEIGPMYSDLQISEGLRDLPFSEEEVAKTLKEVQEAIRTQTRLRSVVDRTSDVLVFVRQLIPLVAGI